MEELVMRVGQPATAKARRWEAWVNAMIPSRLLPEDAEILREAARNRRVAVIVARESTDRGGLGLFVATGQLGIDFLDLMQQDHAAKVIQSMADKAREDPYQEEGPVVEPPPSR